VSTVGIRQSLHRPIVLSGVIAIVMVVAVAGSLVPATRASLIEPMRVLRDE
jgi:ABC-type lipoprotein release transport system permease subunit